MFQVPLKCLENDFSQFWSRLKWISSKNGKHSDLSRCVKLGFEDFFKRYFSFSFDIFISMSRTTLISLLIHSLMFEECFKYLQSDFSQSWSRLKWKSPQRMGKTHIFRDAPKSVSLSEFTPGWSIRSKLLGGWGWPFWTNFGCAGFGVWLFWLGFVKWNLDRGVF